MGLIKWLKNKFTFEEIESITKIRKKIKKKSHKDIIKLISSDYFSKTIENRIIDEYAMELYIENVNKLSLLSLAFVFLTPMISKLFDGMLLAVLSVTLYITVAVIVTILVNRCQFYRMYLKVINDIKEGRIVKSTKIIECIIFQDSSEIQNLNSAIKEVAYTEENKDKEM